jgi:DNA ligase (NAD+)
MDPVFVAGTTVRRATLHNIVNIEKLDLHIGDTVTIEKAGEIIPQVIKADPSRRPKDAKPVKAPKKCPSCGAPVERETDGPHIYCENPACPAQLLERLKHFAGRKQMNIDGLGEKLIEQLITAGALKSIPDLYRLTADRIAGLESEHTRINAKGEEVTSIRKVGQKTADAIMKSIENSKTRGLAHVLAGLGARFLGSTYGRKLAAWAGDVETLQKASIDELQAAIRDSAPEEDDGEDREVIAAAIHAALSSADADGDSVEARLTRVAKAAGKSSKLSKGRIKLLSERFESVDELESADAEGIADALRDNAKVAESLHSFFHSDQAKTTFRELEKLGVQLKETKKAPVATTGRFAGKAVVITGSFDGLTREEMGDRFRMLGAKVSGSVSSKTDFLIAGDDAGGTKTKKAAELGVPVIGPEEVAGILKEHFEGK